MSQSGGAAHDGGRGISPSSLKRKRESQALLTPSDDMSGDVSKAAKLTNGPSSHSHTHNTSSDPRLPSSNQYTSPDSDEMQHSDSGDLLRGIGSASSLNSTASSVFSHNSNALAGNRKASLANGYTPLTNHSVSSPSKGDSPHHTKSGAAMASSNGIAATSHLPTTATTPDLPTQTTRPQMLPLPGCQRGVRCVWDPATDRKLSSEERKRAQPRHKVFGTEVRYIFHDLLSFRKMMIHIT
jgi:histone-lysine N-methyltransferase SETD1